VIRFQIEKIRTTEYHKRKEKRKRARVKLNVILSKDLKIVTILNNLI